MYKLTPRFTQVPNLFLDVLLSTLSGSEFKVLMFMSRRTFGYHTNGVPLSIPEICLGTGLGRQSVISAVSALSRMGLIEVEKSPGKTNAYALPEEIDLSKLAESILKAKDLSDEQKRRVMSAIEELDGGVQKLDGYPSRNWTGTSPESKDSSCFDAGLNKRLNKSTSIQQSVNTSTPSIDGREGSRRTDGAIEILQEWFHNATGYKIKVSSPDDEEEIREEIERIASLIGTEKMIRIAREVVSRASERPRYLTFFLQAWRDALVDADLYCCGEKMRKVYTEEVINEKYTGDRVRKLDFYAVCRRCNREVFLYSYEEGVHS